jgi:DNA-binding MarR family transcriptional regulator
MSTMVLSLSGLRQHRRYDSVLSMSGTVSKRQRAVKKRGPAAEALSALVVNVMKLSATLEAAGNLLASPAGQSSARWQVLAAIEDDPRSVASIARVLGHTRQSVQRIADVLVADGLARYSPNPAHRRAKLLELTPAGLEALRTIQAAQARWARQIARGLKPAELDAARATLTELVRRLDEWLADAIPRAEGAVNKARAASADT